MKRKALTLFSLVFISFLSFSFAFTQAAGPGKAKFGHITIQSRIILNQLNGKLNHITAALNSNGNGHNINQDVADIDGLLSDLGAEISLIQKEVSSNPASSKQLKADAAKAPDVFFDIILYWKAYATDAKTGKNNQAAGLRVRNGIQDMQRLMDCIRREIQTIRQGI